jgi:hypothetical protein
VGGISGEEDDNGLIQASSSKPPMQYVLDALAWTKQAYARHHSRTDSDWVLVSHKSSLPIHRKHSSAILRNPPISVHRGWKVIEGISAEELAVIIREGRCRKGWDERWDFSGERELESFGGGIRTGFVVMKGGFPWSNRGFFVGSVCARKRMSTANIVNPRRTRTRDEPFFRSGPGHGEQDQSDEYDLRRGRFVRYLS